MGDKKKKILYIVTKSNWGGAQRHVFDLATNLPKEKFDVTVAAGGNGILHEKLKTAGIKTINIGALQRDTSLLKDSFSFLTIYRIINREKPDILHLHSPKAGALGAFAARIINLLARAGKLKFTGPNLQLTTIVFTVHGWPFKEERAAWQKFLIYAISWLTVILAHKIIVVSEDDRAKTPIFSTKTKINLIHNGIEPFDCISREESQKKIFGKILNPECLVIGTIAELHKNKGLSFAISAVADIKNRKADQNKPVIYGLVSDGEERKNLEELINKNNLSESVFLAGQVENAKTFLSAFDLFILPSIKEGLPYALLEAGSAGLPVIATNVGGAKEVITDMETGILIRPGEVKEIDYALRFFIQNPEKISEFGGKLRKQISDEFSLEKMVDKTIEVYAKKN